MPPEPPDMPVVLAQEPLRRRASLYPAVGAGIGFTLFLFVLTAGSDWMWAHGAFPEQAMFAADALGAVIGGLLLTKLITTERARVLEVRARHDAMLQRLEMIADLNHHIRNALEMIQLSAHTTHNQELIHNIRLSVDRIQWALRELLPKADENPEDTN